MQTLRDSIDSVSKNIVSGIEISTGFQQLDDMSLGFKRGELTLIAGRPSIGKTAMIVDMALHTSQKYNTGFFSLEMGQQQLIERMIANKQDVSYTDLKKGIIDVKQETKDLLSTHSLWIDDRTGLTPEVIWATIKATKVNFDVIFIDYLQLIRTATVKRARYEELDRITENIRETAKQLNIAFVVAAQLNRAVDNRENHEPRLSDLRETGGIEQTCDKIILLHRPAYYNIYEKSDKDAVDDGEAWLILAKNRNGETGRIPVVWFGKSMAFRQVNFELESF